MRILLTLFITALASTASCVSAQAVGKPCGSFDTCDAGLICKEESTFEKTCATAPAIGEACTYNGPNDKPGTTCASDGWCKRPEYWKASSLAKAAGVCAVLPNLGEKCDGQLWVPCKATKKSAISGIWTSTMYCDTYTMSAQDAICKTKKADGETCVNSFECENFCKDKKCAPGEITINTPSPTTDAPVVTQSPSVTPSPIVTQAPSVTQSPSVTQAPTGTGTGGILGGSTGNTATLTGSLHTGMLMMTILFAACITLLF